MKVDLGYQSVRGGKGWEGWARRRAMKVDLGYQSVRGGRVGRGGQLGLGYQSVRGGGLGEEESYEGGPRVSISKGWEGWARR